MKFIKWNSQKLESHFGGKLPSYQSAIFFCKTLLIWFGWPTVNQCLFLLLFNLSYSELVTMFNVEASEPFSVEPSEGYLQPFESCSVTATFKPTVKIMLINFSFIAQCYATFNTSYLCSTTEYKIDTGQISFCFSRHI